MWFQIDAGLSEAVRMAAAECGITNDAFMPDVRPADQRFGDFQANGVLQYAKLSHSNPRTLAEQIASVLNKMPAIQGKVIVDIAGPGFINFTLSNEFLTEWMSTYSSEQDFQSAAICQFSGHTVVIDYSSPNTAKQMHVGHLRSMNIGDAIYRLLKFCGANVIRDNHVGDWGTQFGILIMAIKQQSIPVESLSLEHIEVLYQQGTQLTKDDPDALSAARRELVDLQNGDPENVHIWKTINKISQEAFDEIYSLAGVSFDYTLGESFYRDKVQQVYQELTECGIAKEDNGALCVFHPEHERFATQPFIIRKADGASNYATTDLATVYYRTDTFHADDIIYVTDGRQQDHFQQLFMTVEKWYSAYNRVCPTLHHVWFGTILGEDGKAIKTRSGTPIKLKELFDESIRRARMVVDEKNPSLPEEERQHIANVLGIDAVKYVDLSSNRTSDYVFSWDKMLSFDGNTAAYLLYTIARIRSVLKKCHERQETQLVSTLSTDSERALARKLTYFPIVLAQAISDLRPHYLCTYLFELTCEYSVFYNNDRIIGVDSDVMSRRVMLTGRTLMILEIGMRLLGLETLERM